MLTNSFYQDKIMAKTISIKASVRRDIGRNAVKAVRKQGKVPGVLYGKREAQALEVNAKDLQDALAHSSSENVLVDLQVQADTKMENRLALIQEVQHHPLKDFIVHIDFHEIAQDEKLQTEVPVEAFGEAAGVKNSGGLLEVTLRHLTVECLPKDLPEIFRVDVSHLELGQAVHVSEIPAPEGVTILNPPDLAVFIVHAPKQEDEKPVAAAEVTQPEVIKEKKVEDAAGDAKAGAKDAKK
jgi:large subunit ribosomal protein L25